MSIRYDLPRGQFFDEEQHYVNPATVAEKLREAEAENERLRCCGNCGFCDVRDGAPECQQIDLMQVGYQDHCHFTPSRWTRREE